MRVLRCLALALAACLLPGILAPVLADDGANALVAAEAMLDEPALAPGTGTPLALDGADTDPFRIAAETIDLTGVAPGAHTLYVRFQDATGLWSAPLGQSFLVTDADPAGPFPGGNNVVHAAEVFLDQDPGEGNGITLAVVDGAFDTSMEQVVGALDLASVEPGPHTLYLRVRDATGQWSVPLGQSFYVTPGDPGNPLPGGYNTLAAAELFLDEDPGAGNAIPLEAEDGLIDASLERLRNALDLGDIEPGAHTLYVRALDATGRWSEPLGQSFYVTPGDPANPLPGGYNRIETAEAFFDVDPGAGNGIAVDIPLDGAIDSAFEVLKGSTIVSGLAPGIHVLHVRFLDSTGVWSPTLRQSLYVSPGADPGAGGVGAVTLVAAEGFVDDNEAIPLAADDGAFDDLVETVTLAAAVSEDAYHTARVRFQDSTGLWSSDPAPVPVVPPNDTDWDGLPDDWERYWFGNLDQSGRDDLDGDGYTNLEELERAQSPLLSEEGGGLSISGLVRDAGGQPLAGVAICISGPVVSNCNVQTDAFGHFVLGGGDGLPVGDYQVEPRATVASGPYSFAPVEAQVTVGTAHVTGVDFVATFIPDTDPPETSITAGPAEGALVTTSAVDVGWSGSDDRTGMLTYAYRLDDQTWSVFDAATATTLTGLSDGTYRFQVKARDAAGNEDATPAERNFTVNATPPEPASAFTAVAAENGIRLDWTNSPSPDVARYRLYWNGGAGDIDYGQPLATIIHPTNAYVVSGLPGEGTYRFGLRAEDAAGNRELNTDVTAVVDIVGLSISVDVPDDTYDRGQDVPVTGSVLSPLGDPVADAPVAIAVRSNGAPRTFTAYTNAQGGFSYVFQPLAGEAGSYTVEATVESNGLEQTASDSFRVLGLWLQPSSLSLDLSMNAQRTVDVTLRNIGDVPLTALQYSVEDLDPADPLTGAIDAAALPDRLEPGEQATVPVTLSSAAGDAPATAAALQVRIDATEGSVETTLINVQLADAVARPVIEPQPLKVGVQPGAEITRTLTVRNAGYSPVASAQLVLHEPDTYPWVQVLSGDLGALAPQQAKEVQVRIAPAADMALGTHVIQLDLSYDGELVSGFIEVEITATDVGVVAVKVHDDTGSVVPAAEVSLISEVFYVNTTPDGGEQEYNDVIQGKTDVNGELTFDDVPAGDYRYLVQAPGHDPLEGDIRVESGTEPQPLAVILITNLVTVDFNVTPTTIEDQYEVALEITYATNLTKPTLFAQPSKVGLSFFPEEAQEGVIRITNTSNNAPVRGVVMGSAALDPVDNELVVLFSNGEKEIDLPDLGPGETVQVPYTAQIPNAATAKLNSRQLGNITVSGKYTYSIDGQALEGTTTTPIPVIYNRPSDLRLPGITFINDEEDGDLTDLEYQGDTYRLEVISNRDVVFDIDTADFDPDLKAVSHINGGPDNASIIDQNAALWTETFNSDLPLTFEGDAVSFDINGLEEALETQMRTNREAFLGHKRSIGFKGRWADRTQNAEPDAYLIPISIITKREEGISVSDCVSCGTGWSLPPVPTLELPQGEVKIQIKQQIGLEREAFDIALDLTPNVDRLDNVTVTLNVVIQTASRPASCSTRSSPSSPVSPTWRAAPPAALSTSAGNWCPAAPPAALIRQARPTRSRQVLVTSIRARPTATTPRQRPSRSCRCQS